MTTKMSMFNEDSIVRHRVVNYTYDEEDCSDNDYENEDDFYAHYEPEDEFDYDNDYQPFNLEEDDTVYISSPKQRVIKPCTKLNSPSKSSKTTPVNMTISPSWWDKNKSIDEANRVINGVLNYAALLPPPIAKPAQPKHKKNKASVKPKPTTPKSFPVSTVEIQKPTRLCLSVIKNKRCFHGAQCRFAHDYKDLKECNFGEKCKKIVIVKTNPDGTFELANKNGVSCNFRHSKESKTSYLKRVPQQNTSPKK